MAYNLITAAIQATQDTAAEAYHVMLRPQPRDLLMQKKHCDNLILLVVHIHE